EGGTATVRAAAEFAVDRQHRAVRPHTRRARRDRLARDHFLERVVVVIDLEGTKTELADVNRCGAVGAAALAALQPLQLFHGLSIGTGIEPRLFTTPTAN